MEPREQQAFNPQEKLDVLRTTKSYFCQFLEPSAIISNMTTFIDSGLKDDILEKERAGFRKNAAELLIDKVIEEGERGLNIFMHALQDWPRLLELLQKSQTGGICDYANEYFAFLIHLLEGEIISKLTVQYLSGILRELYSCDAIKDFEMELLDATLKKTGTLKTAQMMFSLLHTRNERWPEKFFLVIREVHPELLEKIAPYGQNPFVDKESNMSPEDVTEACVTPNSLQLERAELEDVQEQTQPKDIFPLGTMENENAGNASGEGRERMMQFEERSMAADEVHGDQNEAHFSDDEKHNTEESEKNMQERVVPKTEMPKDLDLRKYQKELAEQALQGVNTIICAPTGSGKTRVALHIVQKHLEAAPLDKPGKVVFLARTVPLVSQQHTNFKEYLPQYRSELVTGESENSMTVHHQLEKNDILVLTPKILENHLIPEKIPSLSAFSLIIFDECHHTRKGEPYNSVMKNYLKSKKQREQDLPQIVGLTASIGVEKATTPNEAKESILNIMSNLDVSTISQVKQHTEELRDTVPRPKEELVSLVSRENDPISNKIHNIMWKLAEELDKCEKNVKTDKEVDEIQLLLTKRETDLKSQKFGQWAVNLRNQARLIFFPKNPRDSKEVERIRRLRAFSKEVQIIASWLVAYNEAFDVHDLTRPEDVLHYMERNSKLQREESIEFISTELDEKILHYFKDVQKELTRFSKEKNPNLQKLGQIILHHVENAREDKDGFRILVFVRTRATCRALCRWLNSQDADEQLRLLKAQPFTGTGAHQEQGGMTPYEQTETLKRFKLGDVKLLVTTSVGEEGIDIAECNLTIRYNHVGNEVTTTQTRGRSRKRGGRSILMAMPKIIEQEELNRKKEQLMHDALLLIDDMRPEDIHKYIKKMQTKSLDVEEIDQVMKQAKKHKKQGDFRITCPRCYNVEVDGAQIRTINKAHHVIIGHDIDNKVVIMPGKIFMKLDDWEIHGNVVCKCKERLGQLINYKKATFILVSPKYWIFLDSKNTPNSYKKWTNVPYHIKEVSRDDMKEHLRISHIPGEESDETDEN